MADNQPSLKETVYWLNQICILPYTDEELDAIGCLGTYMAKHKDFADKYMSALLEKRELISQHKRVAFADLNLQIYRRVLGQPNLEQIPDLVVMPDENTVARNNIRERIMKMSQNIKNSQENNPNS